MDETQKLMHAKFDKALYYADKIIPIAHSFAPFNVSYIALYESNWTEEEKQEANDMRETIHDVLIELKYAREQNGNFWIELTNKGRLAKKLGGHLKYVEDLSRIRALKESQIQSVIDTNKLTRTNITTTVILAIFVAIIQLKTCYILEKQANQEEHRLIQDSVQQFQNLQHDSIIYNRPVQVNILMDSLKKK